MPNCDFYAAGEDFRMVLDFIFAQPGWSLFETHSEPDQPLRTFKSSDQVLAAFDLEHLSALMGLYAPSMGGSIVERQIVFRPGAVPGAIGRTTIEGLGIVQLRLESASEGRIRPSNTGHQSETRARNWEDVLGNRLGPVSAWNWREVERISRRLNRHIYRLSVARSGSRVILPEAARRVERGAVLSLN